MAKPHRIPFVSVPLESKLDAGIAVSGNERGKRNKHSGGLEAVQKDFGLGLLARDLGSHHSLPTSRGESQPRLKERGTS